MLALFFAVSFVAAAIGSSIILPEISGWYRALVKPAWTPPDRVFGPVWTFLYVSIAAAAWLAWRAGGWRRAHWLWLGQLGLNTLWSLLFFGMHRVGWAAVEILFLWATIAATAIGFAPLSRWAAALLVPYLAWVSYAAALTWTIFLTN